MKEQLQKCEQHLIHQWQQQQKSAIPTKDLLTVMLSKQKEWSDAMKEYSARPAFTYSMCRLNALHCVVRTQTYGQMTFSNLTSNCYATVKLDYLNQHKQTFISHHDMKLDDNSNGSNTSISPTSLRTAERTLYGVERWTESERMRLYLQCQLRSNTRLLIGRVAVPSRKLMSINMVDPKTLLIDELEHIHLNRRYQNGLFLMERLFQWLLGSPELKENVQYLLGYNADSDEMNIFSKPIEPETNALNPMSDSVDTEPAENEMELFDFNGYIDEFCGDLNCFEDPEVEYIAPYPIMYRGTFESCHIPDIAPPANAELPKPCQMFLFHGFCPKFFAANQGAAGGQKEQVVDGQHEGCDLPHYRTHILNHCWEYALYGGHCERGAQCEWTHLRQQELLNKGMQMFHVRQLINYCQDYYKSGMCKKSRTGEVCHCIHWGEKQLLEEFHTKYKWKQLRKEQLLERGKHLELNLENFKKKQQRMSHKAKRRKAQKKGKR